MKDPKTILTHLFENPLKFQQQRCFSKLKRLLPKNLQESIHYIYKRQKTLYFVLKHPGFVIELNYNKKLIKELLTLLRNKERFCKNIEIEQIKAYAKYTRKKESQIKPMQRYTERAKGEFEDSKEFGEIFQKIKEAIKANGEA